MTSAYENQVLGAFIYALGYESALQRRDGIAINLFQQTPLDGKYGDLVVGASSCIAFEFKRNPESVKSEKLKWSQQALQRFESDDSLRAVSIRAHMLCFGEHANDEIVLNCVPYGWALGLRGVPLTAIHWKLLVDALVKAITDPSPSRSLGVRPEKLESYLRKLALYRREGGGGSRASGSWVAIAKNAGSYRFLTASSLEHLLELEIDKTKDLELDRGLEQERN